jgi:two-component system OmpR family response regulator
MASSNDVIFLVDDEPIQNEMLKDYLSERFLYTIKLFDSGEEALKHMDLNPVIVVLDFHLSADKPNAMNGVEILKKIKEKNPDTDVIMLSGQDKIEVAIDSMKFGAHDYVVKGETGFTRVENALNNVGRYHSMRIANKGYKRSIGLLIGVLAFAVLFTIYMFVIKM